MTFLAITLWSRPTTVGHKVPITNYSEQLVNSVKYNDIDQQWLSKFAVPNYTCINKLAVGTQKIEILFAIQAYVHTFSTVLPGHNSTIVIDQDVAEEDFVFSRPHQHVQDLCLLCVAIASEDVFVLTHRRVSSHVVGKKSVLYRVCHEFRLTKRDDYFRVDYDHFWIEQYFWVLAVLARA